MGWWLPPAEAHHAHQAVVADVEVVETVTAEKVVAAFESAAGAGCGLTAVKRIVMCVPLSGSAVLSSPSVWSVPGSASQAHQVQNSRLHAVVGCRSGQR